MSDPVTDPESKQTMHALDAAYGTINIPASTMDSWWNISALPRWCRRSRGRRSRTPEKFAEKRPRFANRIIRAAVII